MSEETVVVYDHYGTYSTEVGWNTPEDFRRVSDNVIARKGAVVGAIINIRLPESDRFAPAHLTPSNISIVFERTGATVATVDSEGNITTH